MTFLAILIIIIGLGGLVYSIENNDPDGLYVSFLFVGSGVVLIGVKTWIF